MNWSKEQVVEKLRQLYPKAAPAWLQSFAAWLIQNAPAILAAIMALIPKTPAANGSDGQAKALAAVAAAFEVSGHAPQTAKGPIFDGQIHAIMDQVKSVVEEAGASALDYAQAFAEHYLSGVTP